MKIANGFAAFLLLATVSVPVLADSNAVAAMADILAGMNHFPSDEQKSRLESIATETEHKDLRVIANAIKRIEHQPSAADKKKMQAIMDDEAASSAEKRLAGAVLRFNHKAASEDAAALKKLAE